MSGRKGGQFRTRSLGFDLMNAYVSTKLQIYAEEDVRFASIAILMVKIRL